jgi:tetratricopeptide (TPR) repeat protein
VAALGLRYVLEVPSDTPVWPVEVIWETPPYAGRGIRSAPRPVEEQQKEVRKRGKHLPPDAWQEITVAEGAQGARTYRFAAERVREARDGEPGRVLWLVYRENLDGREPRYYVSNAPAETPLATLAWVAAARWPIETELETDKSDVGLDEYEVRSWAGWQHQITMCMLASAFLLTLPQEWGENDASADAAPGLPGGARVVAAGAVHTGGTAGLAGRDAATERAGQALARQAAGGAASRASRLDLWKVTLQYWEDEEQALRLAVALWSFWLVRGYSAEGCERLKETLALGPDRPTPLRAAAWQGLGRLADVLVDLKTARRSLRGSLAMARYLGDDRLVASSSLARGEFLWRSFGLRIGQALGQRAAALFRQLDDEKGLAAALQFLGDIRRAQFDYKTARSHFEESLQLHNAHGDRLGVAYIWNQLGVICHFQSDYISARQYFSDSLRLRRELNQKDALAISLTCLGTVELEQGRIEAAEACFLEACELGQRLGAVWTHLNALQLLGQAAHWKGDRERAHSFYDESLSLSCRHQHLWGPELGDGARA